MANGPGTRIIRQTSTKRVVNGTEVIVVELVWNGIVGRSFDVYVQGECLTEDQSFDFYPTDVQIAALLRGRTKK